MTMINIIKRIAFAITNALLWPLGRELSFAIKTVDEFDADGTRHVRVVGTGYSVEKRRGYPVTRIL